MGFRFRKSFGKGPFRLNISKSGIGWSVGTKGARYTKKATGSSRTTLSVPGTGMSYVTETSKTKPKKEKSMKKNKTQKASVVTNENPKPKKPFYKRWWFWVIVVACLISSCTGGNDRAPIDETPSTVIEETVNTTVDTEFPTGIPSETPLPEVTESPVTEIVPPVVEETQELETTPPAIEETAPPATEAPKVLVYTTPHGEKYHTERCRHIQDSETTEWNIEDVPSNYSPCGTCKPR